MKYFVLAPPVFLVLCVASYRTASTHPALAATVTAPLSQFWQGVSTHEDGDYLYVGSNGMPQHNMMIGIRSWQQQVPLPQPYERNNSWKIPLHPKISDHPISARTGLYRGAIAIAINGVPIFNALNNRGEDAFLAGELDKWGGHAGRADDYHYHIAPLFLQKSPDQPIAFALDGFPIFGLTEPDGSPVKKLDEFNGHCDDKGNYHYHATKTYPYINGGLRGVVSARDGQIDPQPNAIPIRAGQSPLRGATITNFKTLGPRAYSLEYSLSGAKHRVDYAFDEAGHYTFHFVDENGRARTEEYSRREPPKGEPPQSEPPRNSADFGRKPWLEVHASKMDSNGDGVLTLPELLAEADKVFRAYDLNNNNQLTTEEIAETDVHSPLAGYIGQHAREIDASGDGAISKEELVAHAREIFKKSDGDGDGDGKIAF